ncbi:uncharacterized protein LOC111373007 [Olea europaea var. sylvestris]|uniref:uncharacterized protein LOC111373007 n=1 Tax=Olea europaea var. sylvestris TaxID=158386 RepID=UPI000C1D62B5|nr:uncharacterized protein LOC111373007 [Olea europaea var. sylvestris]
MSRVNQNKLIRDILQMIQDLGKLNQNPTPTTPLAPITLPTHASVVELFRRHKPPAFDGASSPLEVKEWLRKLERIFRLIDCTDTQKTRTPEQQLALTWEQFKDEVMNKYFPQSLRDFKENEFLQLKQGNMSLIDYKRKFDQLSKYTPHLKANAEQHRQLYNQQDRGHIGKMKWNGQDKGKGKWQNKKANIGSSASKAIVATVTPCLKCGKPHCGKCLYGKNACFRCSKPRHIAKDCPMFTQKKDDNSDQNKKGKAQVFTLT